MSASETPTAGSESTAPGFLRHVMNYGGVAVLMKAVALLMVPLYTLWLAEEEYGVIGLTGLVLVVLAELFGRHLLSGMSRQYFLAPTERARKLVVSSTTLSVAALAWVVCGTALVFHEQLTPLLLGRGDDVVSVEKLENVLLLTLLVLPCQLTTQAGFSYLLIRKLSREWAGVQLAKMALELSLKVLFVGLFGWSVEGYIGAILVGELAATVFLTGAVLRRVGFGMDHGALREIARFGLPLVPVGVFQLGLHQIDRRLLEHLSPAGEGLANAGIYGLGYLVAATPGSVLLNALFSAWQPSLYAIEDRLEQRRLLARDTTRTVLALTAVCALTAFAGQPLVELLASRPGYLAAYRVVPWVACATVFWGLYAALQLGFYVERRTGALILLNLLALVANVTLNFLLVPRFGTVGSAAATLVAFACLAGLAAISIRRVMELPLEGGRLLGALALALVFAGLAGWLDRVTVDWSLVQRLAVRAAGLCACLAVLVTGALNAGERRDLREHALLLLARVRRRPAG